MTTLAIVSMSATALMTTTWTSKATTATVATIMTGRTITAIVISTKVLSYR